MIELSCPITRFTIRNFTMKLNGDYKHGVKYIDQLTIMNVTMLLAVSGKPTFRTADESLVGFTIL